MIPQESVCLIAKPDTQELLEIVDIALDAGGLMLQYGAETEKVEETVAKFGKALGCDIANILITLDSILITVISQGKFSTKVKKIVRGGVNFTILTEVDRLAIKAYVHKLDKEAIKSELSRIVGLKPNYKRYMVVMLTGLACGAFCRLFGGDMAAFFVTTIASSIAIWVRILMIHSHYNTFMTTAISAFIATIIAYTAKYVSATPDLALAASVLMLIPGVPLINSTEDLIKGHINVGIFRGVLGLLVSLSIALGIMVALRVLGYSL